MAHGERRVGCLSVFLPGETGLGVEEIIAFVNVENLIVQPGGGSIELVVDAVGVVVDVSVLHIAENAPLVADAPGGFGKNIGVQLACIGVIVGVVSVFQQLGAYGFRIDQTAEMVGLELLNSISCDRLETFARVVDIGHHAEEILVETLFAGEIVCLHTVKIGFVKTELRYLAVGLVVVIVAVAVGVVEGGVEFPQVGKIECSRQDVAVLPEMVVSIERIAVIGVGCLIIPFVE